MKLPKELTAVTSFSKTLSIILSITFFLLGFYLGMTYQKQLQLNQSTIGTVEQPLSQSEKEIRKRCYEEATNYVSDSKKDKMQNPVNWHMLKFEECLKKFGLKPIIHYTDYSYTYE
ncbi:hypothetical protein HY345_03045 [Candidatus Microgenomates bacterium]|nr:hypothetical protein [Candidatus Microgenomates bacterium]